MTSAFELLEIAHDAGGTDATIQDLVSRRGSGPCGKLEYASDHKREVMSKQYEVT